MLDLRAFCLVADLRSLTAASQLLGESKATVSRRIARLEQSLDVSLLRRSPRLVEPTDDGVAYRQRVGQILELLGDANTAVRQSHAAPSGKLRVTAPPEFGSVLAPHIAAFNRRFPEVLLDLVIAQKLLDFESEHLDVAFRVHAKLPDSPLIAHKLFDIEGATVGSPAYFAEMPAPRQPADLTKHRVVLMQYECAQHPLPFQRADGKGPVTDIRLQPSIAASDMNFVKELALAGAGIAVLPINSVRRELEEGTLVWVLKSYRLFGAAIYLMHQGGRFLPPKVRAFRDFVLDAFAAKGRRVNGR
ncbi:LysR substrate-binding domain-containing protein [Pendulispora brunnea]|uniref:LysR substrate-binding domain-containing protein n=1 Tax=Pendulispora brunnea TaxID=2905690 RepID=A0ABZ2KII7_9BACT